MGKYTPVNPIACRERKFGWVDWICVWFGDAPSCASLPCIRWVYGRGVGKVRLYNELPLKYLSLAQTNGLLLMHGLIFFRPFSSFTIQ
jgi:hypothetical protein